MEHLLYHRRLRHWISTPFIWMMIVPIILADILGEVYHRICFPLYGLPYVKRSRYIRIDRFKLRYLTFSQKMSCLYCGYVNGWLHYASIMASETERYWCAIQHRRGGDFVPPEHHQNFIAYDDEGAFREKFSKKRDVRADQHQPENV